MDHWLSYGRFEGRAPKNGVNDDGFQQAKSVNLETMFYANQYADLKNAFGYDAEQLYQHWLNYGKKEGRVPNAATAALLVPAPRSAHMQSIMRSGDWLLSGQRMVSPNGAYRLDLQPDAQFVIYQGNPSDSSRRWYQNSQGFPTNVPYFALLQTDGHICTYKGTSGSDNQGFIGCSPSGAGGPVGRYTAVLQDDGNLVIYKGTGPDNNVGYVWDRTTTKPSSGFDLNAAVQAVGNFVVSTANASASGYAGAANTVAAVSAAAANDLAREVTASANQVTTTIVNTANKVANDTVGVAVTVGRGVEQGGKIVGNEIVRNGEVVGYAVADLAVDAWNCVNSNCGLIGRKVFAIDGYFQGAKQITGAISTVGASYGAIDKSSAAAMKTVTDAANQCFEQVQDGFYCAFPQELKKIVSQTGTIPGNLVNLATRVFNEAKTQECLIVGAATVTFGALGLEVCALGKVVVPDAQKAFACFSAVESRSIMKKFFAPGDPATSQSFPNKAACEGIGELAFTVAEKIFTNGLSAEAKAAKAAGKSNTLAMVAGELRSVYKVASRGAKFEAVL